MRLFFEIYCEKCDDVGLMGKSHIKCKTQFSYRCGQYVYDMYV